MDLIEVRLSDSWESNRSRLILDLHGVLGPNQKVSKCRALAETILNFDSGYLKIQVSPIQIKIVSWETIKGEKRAVVGYNVTEDGRD